MAAAAGAVSAVGVGGEFGVFLGVRHWNEPSHRVATRHCRAEPAEPSSIVRHATSKPDTAAVAVAATTAAAAAAATAAP